MLTTELRWAFTNAVSASRCLTLLEKNQVILYYYINNNININIIILTNPVHILLSFML